MEELGRPIRTLGVNHEWKYTKLGTQFFSKRHVEVVLGVPVRFGKRKNNQPYKRFDWLPTDRLGVGQLLANEAIPEHVRLARAKQQVLSALGVHQGDQIVLLEISGETYYYDPHREWKVSTMTTSHRKVRFGLK